jgi:hypothetical protein
VPRQKRNDPFCTAVEPERHAFMKTGDWAIRMEFLHRVRRGLTGLAPTLMTRSDDNERL